MNGAALLAMLASLAGVGLAAASGLLISRAALRPDDFLSLTLLVTTVRALGLGRAGLRYTERLTGHAHALSFGARLRLQWFDTVSRFGRDLLRLERRGDLLSRAQADVDAQQMWTLRVPLPLLSFVAVTAVLSAAALTFDVLLACLMGAPLLLTGWVALRQRHEAAALARTRQALLQAHGAQLLDTLAGSADGAAHTAQPQLAALNRQLMTAAARSSVLAWRLTLTRETLFTLAVTGVLWRGAALLDAGTLGGPWLAGLVLATAASFDAATLLGTLPAAHAERTGARERAQQLAQHTPLVTETPVPTPLPDGPLPLELRDVTLRRGDRQVLDRVQLHVPAGTCLVLTGPSGAGKTTLLHLITRDLDPDSGSVTLAGVPVRTAALTQVRRAVSLHPQHAPLLDGSVRENLRLADPALSDERLQSLLAQVGLSHLHPDQWVGESGTQLSGGERARLSILRALIAPSRIVLLDEPTAHLDTELERAVLQAIQTERRGRTLIIASHRPATLSLADQVVHLEAAHLSPLRPSLSQQKVISMTRDFSHGFVSGFHRNSAYLERRAALTSTSDTSGRIDKAPVLIQSCRTSIVRNAIFTLATLSE